MANQQLLSGIYKQSYRQLKNRYIFVTNKKVTTLYGYLLICL